MSMFNKMFNKESEKTTKKTEFVASESRVINRAKSHKKKNTYIVAVSNIMADLSLFGLCQETPIAVVSLNGQKIQDTTGFMKCTQFPNPVAANMQILYKKFAPVMGAQMACTIVEYLDKYTGKPVITLFPQNQAYFHGVKQTAQLSVTQEQEGTCLWLPDALAQQEVMKLNHASRADLFKQIQKRQNMLTQNQQKQH